MPTESGTESRSKPRRVSALPIYHLPFAPLRLQLNAIRLLYGVEVVGRHLAYFSGKERSFFREIPFYYFQHSSSFWSFPASLLPSVCLLFPAILPSPTPISLPAQLNMHPSPHSVAISADERGPTVVVCCAEDNLYSGTACHLYILTVTPRTHEVIISHRNWPSPANSLRPYSSPTLTASVYLLSASSMNLKES